MATLGSRAYGSYQDTFRLFIKLFKWSYQPIQYSLYVGTLNLLEDMATVQITSRIKIDGRRHPFRNRFVNCFLGPFCGFAKGKTVYVFRIESVYVAIFFRLFIRRRIRPIYKQIERWGTDGRGCTDQMRHSQLIRSKGKRVTSEECTNVSILRY